MSKQRRCFLFLYIFVWPICCALSAVHAEQNVEIPYVHNLYFTTGHPTGVYHGRYGFDISTPEGMDDMFGELARLGINAATYHSAYRIDGADYEPRDKRLKRAARWPAESRPVKMFLATCQRHKIAGYLAVFIYPEMNVEMARLASDDIADVFRDTPGFEGYTPPIEGSPVRGVDNATFLDICRSVKRRAPGILIMDYPNGPYSPTIVRMIVERGDSGVIDIENIQYHVADERLKNFVISRGMAHLVMGMCSRSRTIVHTHYKYGGGKAWLAEDDAYKVHQGAVITATPYGTSIFSYQHGFWGEQSGPVPGDALWRRIEWYRGILEVQRLASVYGAARNLSAAAIMIPARTLEGGQEIVERYWLPFARAQAPVQMFTYKENLSPRAQVIVCPLLETCDAKQRRLLEELAAAGRTIVIAPKPDAALDRYMSERTRRILKMDVVPKLIAADLSPAFFDAFGGLPDTGRLAPVTAPIARPFGKGRVIRAPFDTEWLAENLTQVAPKVDALGVRAEGLPPSYVLEHWQMSPLRGGTELVLILATEQGAKNGAEGVKLRVPWQAATPTIWFLDNERAEPITAQKTNGELLIELPSLGDSWAAVTVGPTDAPTLRPQHLVIRTKTGQKGRLACALTNTTDAPVEGQVEVSPPINWRLHGETVLDYQLKPGESVRWEIVVDVPRDAERRPYFVLFRDRGQTQRTVIFPENGRPQIISDKPVPPNLAAKPKRKARPHLLGAEWRSVTAGEDFDDTHRGRIPGVHFMGNGEWDPPQEFQGKMARYGEVIPRLGGPNFLVNNPDPKADLEVRLTFIAQRPGKISIYDGVKYHDVGKVPKAEKWTTTTYRVPREPLAAPKADRPFWPGRNVMFQLLVDGIYVHRIEARRAQNALPARKGK